jgi:HSP20 family molecular chaperone IbpA
MGDVADCLSAAYECISSLIEESQNSDALNQCQSLDDVRGSRDFQIIRVDKSQTTRFAPAKSPARSAVAQESADHRMPWLSVDFHESEQFVYALASVWGYAGRNLLIGLEPGWLAILAHRPWLAWEAASNHGWAPTDHVGTLQTFCVISLPAEVNPVNSIAVLAKGLLGIRMPKAPA